MYYIQRTPRLNWIESRRRWLRGASHHECYTHVSFERMGDVIGGPMPGQEIFDKLLAKSRTKSTAGVSEWFRSTYHHPMLTPEQSHHVTRRLNYHKWRYSRGLVAGLHLAGYVPLIDADRELLVKANMRMIGSAMKQWPKYDQGELFSVGQLTLVRAVDMYDPFAGSALSTYLRGSLAREMQKACSGEHGHEHDALSNEMVAREMPVVLDDDEPTAAVQDAAGQVGELLAALPARDARWMRSLWGVGVPQQTHAEVASDAGVSVALVRQREAAAMAAMRQRAGVSIGEDDDDSGIFA